MRTVGVLGGMGPAATLDFMAKALAAGQGAAEQDNIRLIVDCNPHVPDRNAALRDEGPSPGPILAAMARGLEAAGAEFLVMACHTAHAWRADIEAATDLPFVSIVDEACAHLRTHHGEARRIGVLAAQGCLDASLYQTALAAEGFEPLTPAADAQSAFMLALYRVKAGEIGPEAREAMAAAARDLIEQGAQVVLAACTEVPLVLRAADVSAPLIDVTRVLAERTVAYARGEAFPAA
ncbi:MAG TPA: amino acid racemase, partial [Caulobacteraceae bacterium]|nr:amino acid racemase [Caulobacteraceae bacterium]